MMGLDGLSLIDTAEEAQDILGPDGNVEENIAVQLGALLGVAAQAGRDKLTFILDDTIAAFVVTRAAHCRVDR